MLAIVIETNFGAKWHLTADLALIDANVRTMNPRQPIAQAVAIKKNRIVKVGTNQEIKKLIGKDTKVINLNGKTSGSRLNRYSHSRSGFWQVPDVA